MPNPEDETKLNNSRRDNLHSGPPPGPDVFGHHGSNAGEINDAVGASL